MGNYTLLSTDQRKGSIIIARMIAIMFPLAVLVGLAGMAEAATVPAPTNLTATMASSRQINLAWTDNATTETNYYVERSPNGSSSWTVVATLGANITSYQNTGLTQNTRYYYRVRCKAGTTYSSYSNTANTTTATLAAPTSLTATVASATQIALNWTDNTAYETQYSIERSPNGSSSWTVLGTVATNITTTTNSGLTAGTAYYYRVRAYDSTNYSAYSNTANQTIRTITASAGANGTINPSGAVGVANGGTMAFTMTPNSGYKIATVTVNGGAVATNPTYTFTNVTSNQTISATFSVNTFTITASAGPNGSISPAGAVVVTGGANQAFTMTPNSGYKIESVVVDGGAVATNPTYTFTNVTATHTISATFSANTVTITASAGANGTITPSGAVAVTLSTNQSFTITPNANYRISDVVVDGSSVGTPSLYTFPAVTTTHSIVASFVVNTFAISATSGPNGTISPAGVLIVNSGATPTFTAAPNQGYRILDMKVDGASVGSAPTYTFSPVTANHTIEALFTVQTFTITAAATAYGSITPSGAQTVNYGDSRAFNITPIGGYHISDVLVDGVSVGTPALYTFSTVTSSHTITASFSNTWSITATAGANGSISPSGVSNVPDGQNQTYTITPNANYHINDVVVDGSSVGKVPSYTFSSVVSAHTISASFAADTVISGGTITTNTTWTLAGSPYVVSGSIILAGTPTTPATLTIEAGVVVKFGQATSLTIGSGSNKGALVTLGTSTNRVMLTRNGSSGDWSGITFSSATSSPTTTIQHTDISNITGIGIAMTTASPVIKNSTLSSITGWGMNLFSESNPVLENVAVSINGAYGISLNSSSPNIMGGSLSNTSLAGHGIYGSGSPSIANYVVSLASATGYYGLYASTTTSSLSVINSTIDNGLYIGSNGVFPTITGNTFTKADYAPIHAGANLIDQIMDNNTVTGMTVAGKIEVVGEVINRTVRWKNWPAPYWVMTSSIDVYKDAATAAQLTVDPGTTVKFAANLRINVARSNGTDKGILIAQGTGAERIKFTRSAGTGWWGGFLIYGASNGTIFENVDIEYTSSGVWLYSCSPTFRYSTITDTSMNALYLYNASPLLEGVAIVENYTGNGHGISLAGTSNPMIIGGSLTNTSPVGHGIYGPGSPNISNYSITVANNVGNYGIYTTSTTSAMMVTGSTIGNGLFLPSMTSVPTISGNIFTNGDVSPLHTGANIIDLIVDNNTLSGLSQNGRIEVVGETVTRSPRWKKWIAPYVVTQGAVVVRNDSGDTATLTIDPGVTVKFNTSAGMMVGGIYSYNRGKLVAQGTAENRIVFTSSQTTPAPGNWGSLNFQGSASSASVMDYVTVEYGGQTTASVNYYANVIFDYSAAPIIRNSIIRRSSNSGIYIGSTLGWPTIIDSEITNNRWGVYSLDAIPAIMNSTITGNTNAGVHNASTLRTVDARGNWWGMATGPTYTGNPGGAGDRISDRVLYNPWLGQAPGTGFRFTDLRVLPLALNPDGDFVLFSGVLTAAADWTLTITDSNNNIVRTLTGSGSTLSQRWYGENDSAVKVVDGAYNYRITALNTATGETAIAPLGMVVVSRQIPIAILNLPTDNQMFTGGQMVNIAGTANDTDFKNYIVEYGAGDNPGYWYPLTSLVTTPVTSGALAQWDTSSLFNGSYSVRLTVTDNANNVATETSRVRLLWIQNPVASEAYISPNGAKPYTTITATFTYDSAWTVKIKNVSNAVVRTYSGTGISVAQAWDGKDEALTVVPDGLYTWQIDATSTETSVAAVAKTGTVTVDSANPVALISAPTSSAVLRNVIPVIGSATDANFESYKIEYGPSAGTGPWTLIANMTSAVSNTTLVIWTTNDQANTIPVSSGNYLLRLTAQDKAGNIGVASVPVSVDNLYLSNIGVTSNTIDTFAGQSSTVFFTISSQATVTLKIVPELQGPNGAPVYQASQYAVAAGAYSFVWDGKNNAGVVQPDEAYLYILEAGDGIRTDTYSPAVPTGAGSVSCTQSTGFDPLRNMPLTVTYTPAQPSRVNINIHWSDQDFRILDAGIAGPGANLLVWEGRNPSNRLLDAGARPVCSIASLLRENYIITTGDAIRATDVTTDPYIMHLAYGHFTRISYTLPRDANVTLQLISPSGTISTLVSNQAQTAGTHELTWNGLDAGDPTGTGTLITEEGDYAVSLQTTNPATGTSRTYKANLRLGF